MFRLIYSDLAIYPCLRSGNSAQHEGECSFPWILEIASDHSLEPTMMLAHRKTSSSPLRRDNIRPLLNKETAKLMLACASMVGAFTLGLQPANAIAATTTATFTVSAVVPAACALSADSMSFGTYSGSALSTTSTITATCTSSTPYSIALDAGLNAGTPGDTSTRRLGFGGSYIAYDLFQDAAHSDHWGNTVGTDVYTGTGSGSSQAISVYGSLAAGTVPAPGTYSDTITATLTY
jgi:spore coat protein U-like protein